MDPTARGVDCTPNPIELCRKDRAAQRSLAHCQGTPSRGGAINAEHRKAMRESKDYVGRGIVAHRMQHVRPVYQSRTMVRPRSPCPTKKPPALVTLGALVAHVPPNPRE